MTAVAGIDLGATTVRAALADERGRLRSTATEPTPTESGEAIADAIQTVFRAAADGAGTPVDALSAVGIGAMGPLDRRAGAVVDPPNVPNVDRIPVIDAVGRLHDGTVVIHNDATAGAIGERFYSDDDCKNLAYLTISSGIGAGAIVDGHVLRGSTGNAAEMGHVTVEPNSSQRCGCGGVGHWEALCSGNHIPETARTLAESDDIETALDLSTLTAPVLFDAVGSDPLADAVVDRLAEWNAQGVATLVHAYDPERVRIGGAVATNNSEAVVDPLRRRLGDYVIGAPPTIELTALGGDAVLRGAVASVLTPSEAV